MSSPMWRRRKQPLWLANPDVDDSVLVWRAVEPLLPRKLGRVGVAGTWFSGGGSSAGHLFTGPAADQLMATAGPNEGSFRMSTDKAPYELAAASLAERLTEEDRAQLRASGRLPEWFVPELRKQAEVARAQLRKDR